jgi:hypothetical protein
VVHNEFYPVDIILPWSMLTYHRGMNNRPVGGRSSETLSHPINMIIIIIINAMEQSFREANSAFRLLWDPPRRFTTVFTAALCSTSFTIYRMQACEKFRPDRNVLQIRLTPRHFINVYFLVHTCYTRCIEIAKESNAYGNASSVVLAHLFASVMNYACKWIREIERCSLQNKYNL